MLLSDERVNVHKNGSKWHEKKRMKVYVCMGMCVCVCAYVCRETWRK